MDKLDRTLDSFLSGETTEQTETKTEVIKTDKSLVERIDKKVFTPDGRQLLT